MQPMRRNSGQAAIIFILIIALIFLFTAITVNVGKVADVKNTLSIAADGAATNLAASLGSYSGLLREKGESAEGWDLGYIVQEIIGLAHIIYGIVKLDPGAIQTGVVLLGSGAVNRTLVGLDMGIANRKLVESGLDLKDLLREQAIQYALARVVDDPTMVKDIYDGDEDGDKDEDISRFAVWYYARTNSIAEALGEMGNSLVSSLEDFQPHLENFRNEMVNFSDFLEGEFIPLLKELKGQGFNVSFWKEGVDWDKMGDENPAPVNDDIDRLRYIINYSENEDTFETFVADTVENLDDGVLIVGEVFKLWRQRLYDPENDNSDGDDWYSLFGRHSTAMDAWLVELRDIRDRLTEQDAKEKVNDAIKNIKSANNPMNGSIQEFRAAVDGLKTATGEDYFTMAGETIAPHYNSVIYSWEDSRGPHHVKVYVGGFRMPELDIDTHWYGKTDYDLYNAEGTCTVEVTRFDGGRNTYLWDFRYTKDAEAGDFGDNAEAALKHGIKVRAERSYYCGGAN